jgi:hypothetical protein
VLRTGHAVASAVTGLFESVHHEVAAAILSLLTAKYGPDIQIVYGEATRMAECFATSATA